MGSPLPIQATEIECYARIHGFMVDIQFFYRCMTELDLEFFKRESLKSKAKSKSKDGSKKS